MNKVITKNLLKNKLCDNCLFVGNHPGRTISMTCENSQRYSKEKSFELPKIRTCERWKQTHFSSEMYDYE